MSSEMKPLPFETLLDWMLEEYDANRSIFGIDEALFWRPASGNPLAVEDIYGQHLATPVGPAAGPHTQLAQNIVCAWLCGGRFIELKTVQIMDELDIPRPCIDMRDEGYNVEWSQELKLEESADEYIKAWALIHALRRLLGFESQPFGTIFNLSVGYDLEGVRSAPMTAFLDRLDDASARLAEIEAVLAARRPELAGLDMPARISNNVCLSTMHGCPPDEIERIAAYLLTERGLHTAVKLNPTLLGPETVAHILQDHCGYEHISVPEAIFQHDLPWDRAVELIRGLQATAAESSLRFGVKLSNTLPTVNRAGVLPGDETYMSGRALYPLTINLFAKVREEFGDTLPVSYSGGADALNIAELIGAGATTVTVATDLLKPGGYGRFGQYLEAIEVGPGEVDLETMAAGALDDPRYRRDYHPGVAAKVPGALPRFDCITAPCMAACAITQDVPDYARLIAAGDDDGALAAILARNPLPGVTGCICTHVCQTRCTRSDYDKTVAIRALKRFAVEHGEAALAAAPATGHRVAIIGGGPSGLAAAACLALSGVEATVFESRDEVGGMPAIAPDFRLPKELMRQDVARIEALGVKIERGTRVTAPPRQLLDEGYDAVYLACGFQRDATLGIEGEEGPGVVPALRLLEGAQLGEAPELGKKVLVIGGGNTAMDAARTAQRLGGRPVTVVYRRTRAEMPADGEEIDDLLAEGNELENLVSPLRVLREDGRVTALECIRNQLGPPDESGRRRPEPIAGSEFEIDADTVIVAIGQGADLDFLGEGAVVTKRGGAIVVDESGQAGEAIYAGGDVTRGPAIIVAACADGRRAAEAICVQLGVEIPKAPAGHVAAPEVVRELKIARTRKSSRHRSPTLPVAERTAFQLVEQTLGESGARDEAARCLQCSLLCDKCVEVCPNRANQVIPVTPGRRRVSVLRCTDGRLEVAGTEDLVITQARQIVHLDDLCNECGNCATFCVHEGRPYIDKPRLFLDADEFARAAGNAYHFDGETLHGCGTRLTPIKGGWQFEDEHLRVTLDAEFAPQHLESKVEFAGERSLCEAAVMAMLQTGIVAALPGLTGGAEKG